MHFYSPEELFIAFFKSLACSNYCHTELLAIMQVELMISFLKVLAAFLIAGAVMYAASAERKRAISALKGSAGHYCKYNVYTSPQCLLM